MTRTFTATNKESGNYTVLEPDNYDATFKGYEEYAGTFGPALKLFFAVDTDSGEEEVTGIAGLPKNGSMNTKSKLRDWLEGIIGHKLADGEAVDIDTLEGAACRVVLDIVEKPRDDGTKATFNRIVKVLPARKKKAAGAEELV